MRMGILIRKTLKLQVHRVVGVRQGAKGVLEARLDRIRGRLLFCGNCGKKAKYRDRRPARRWRDLFVLTQPLVLVYRPCRVSCHTCGVRVEALGWALPRARVTLGLAHEVALWSRRLSWKDASDLFRINWKTVVAIVRHAVEWGLEHRVLKTVHEMGMDEVSRKKGHKYLTLFWDLRRKVLLWIGEDRTEATVEAFFEWFGKRRAKSLRAVCLDMWKPYLNVVRAKASQAVCVFDRFHLVRHLNEAVDKVRREIMAKANSPWGSRLKNTRYLWITNPWNLKQEKRLQLRALMNLNMPLARAYILKEAFHKFWDYTYKKAAENWLDLWTGAVFATRLKPLHKIARMVENHRQGILAWVDLRISNGVVEGMNNKIGLVKRRCYGLRKPEYQKLAIYHCCANLPLPPF
ncbi:MAG: ISL3 family transposase [Chloroflexota bacterium]